MSDYFLGEIRLFAFTFAPQTWAFCNGATMQISQNKALFTLLGVQFGGDGQSTFNLPDLRGRTPVHVNTATGTTSTIVTGAQGATSGVDSYALAATESFDHLHAVTGTSANGSSTRYGTSQGAFMPATAIASTGTGQTDPVYVAPTVPADYVTLAPGAVLPLGAAVPHENRQPYLAANYCIALQGLYPQRP